MKHIVVVGLGGVGGYFGFRINQFNETAKQFAVSFVARNQTYDIVKNTGLTLLSPEHSNSITKPNHIFQNIFEYRLCTIRLKSESLIFGKIIHSKHKFSTNRLFVMSRNKRYCIFAAQI